MKCPFCQGYTTDNGYKCINCGEILPDPQTTSENSGLSEKKKEFNKNNLWYLVILLGIFILIYLHFTAEKVSSTQSDQANMSGMRIDIKQLIKPGKENIIDFYSDYCGPCRKLSPLLERLDKKREDIILIRLDINRPGVRGIDWRSPLAQQYNIRSVPFLVVFDSSGNKKLEGRGAYYYVAGLLYQEGIN